MKFAYPSQRPQDWLSQQWCICTGRRVNPDVIPWLMGPYGNEDVIEDRYVEQLAASENLVLQKNKNGFGLLESINALNLSKREASLLKPQIADFYENTLRYEFEVWSQWNSFFRPFAGGISRLYSRRLQQLNLPLQAMDTAYGIKSQIYKLVNSGTGKVQHTIWYRHLKSSGHVIYSGVYTTCVLPDGGTCLKVIFPLPRGNATVIMRPEVDEVGALSLISRGRKFGDPGFYFLLEDAKGNHWARHIPSFHESIRLFVDRENVLRTDHYLHLWGCKTLHLHYRINPIRCES